MARKKVRKGFTIIRDTREKTGWDFPANEDTGCLGTIEKGLPTGDYSVIGYESVFTIERKKSTGEWSQNIAQDRFERELERLAQIPHAFIVLGFEPQDIECFPARSSIPMARWRYLRITPEYLWKRTLEIQCKYRVPILFAGDKAPEICLSLCKWVVNNVQLPPGPASELLNTAVEPESETDAKTDAKADAKHHTEEVPCQNAVRKRRTSS